MHDVVRKITSELRGAWRFRWIAVALTWAIALAGWSVVMVLPDEFEAEATVYVDTNSALRPLLEKMTVGTDVLGRVELITTAMLGRPLLEQVAQETGLDLRANSSEEMDFLITNMRENIDIFNQPRRDPNLYRISFQDSDPNTAQAVVSSLVTIFVEDTLGENRVDSQKAQEFLRDELAKLATDLETSEKELADFKKRNVGRMPGEGGDYFDRLQTVIEQLEITETNLSLATRKRDALKRQLAGEQPTLNSSTGIQSEIDVRISENQARLEELQLRFTDRHPDVIAVKETLAQLQAQKKQQVAELLDGEGSGIASDNPVFQNIQIELTNVNVEIETLKEQQASQNEKVRELRNLVDILPEIEAQLARLTRDYDVKRTQYESLLQRLEVAELSESAEESEDVQFRIIDPPVVPENPTGPNRPLFMLAVLAIAVGTGGALAFMLNQLRAVFHDPVSLREMVAFPVLGEVSVVHSDERNGRRRGQILAFSSSMVLLFSALVVAVMFGDMARTFFKTLV